MSENSSKNMQNYHMPDVQSYLDKRNINIQNVGVRGVKYPLIVLDTKNDKPQHTIGDWALTVFLPADKKGTHMSRFINLLHMHRDNQFDISGFEQFTKEMTHLLEAPLGRVSVGFAYFIEKIAPVSGIKSLLDYKVEWVCEFDMSASKYNTSVTIQVPVMSLCPCSKEISEYGAHNQRSHITVTIHGDICKKWDSLIPIIESQASCQIWGLLKRTDEKFVTEKSYENPKFVEDLIRDVAVALQEVPDIKSFNVSVENFESIHNHSAFAKLEFNTTDF